MNKGFKSVDEVNKHLDLNSKGREKREPNNQPAGSTWKVGPRETDNVCVKPTGRTPAEDAHCLKMQKKQMEQSNAMMKLKLGESVVVARTKAAVLNEEVYIVLEGKKIFIESASTKNLEKIDITELCPHEFKSELADNKDVQENGFDQAFVFEIRADVLPGSPGSFSGPYGPTQSEPPEVDLDYAKLIIDKDGSGLSRDFEVNLTKELHKHKKFNEYIEDKMIDTVFAPYDGDYR